MSLTPTVVSTPRGDALLRWGTGHITRLVPRPDGSAHVEISLDTTLGSMRFLLRAEIGADTEMLQSARRAQLTSGGRVAFGARTDRGAGIPAEWPLTWLDLNSQTTTRLVVLEPLGPSAGP